MQPYRELLMDGHTWQWKLHVEQNGSQNGSWATSPQTPACDLGPEPISIRFPRCRPDVEKGFLGTASRPGSGPDAAMDPTSTRFRPDSRFQPDFDPISIRIGAAGLLWALDCHWQTKVKWTKRFFCRIGDSAGVTLRSCGQEGAQCRISSNHVLGKESSQSLRNWGLAHRLQKPHVKTPGPPHVAMIKFIASGVGFAGCRVAKQEVKCGRASGATFKELKTSPEVVFEFHREFSCDFFARFFVLKYHNQNALKNSPESRGHFRAHVAAHSRAETLPNRCVDKTSEGCNQNGAN